MAPARPAPMMAVGIEAPALEEDELPELLDELPLDEEPELEPEPELEVDEEDPRVEVPVEACATTELLAADWLARMEDCPALTAVWLALIPEAVAITVAFALAAADVMFAAAELRAAGFVARGTR